MQGFCIRFPDFLKVCDSSCYFLLTQRLDSSFRTSVSSLASANKSWTFACLALLARLKNSRKIIKKWTQKMNPLRKIWCLTCYPWPRHFNQKPDSDWSSLLKIINLVLSTDSREYILLNLSTACSPHHRDPRVLCNCSVIYLFIYSIFQFFFTNPWSSICNPSFPVNPFQRCISREYLSKSCYYIHS